MSTPEILPENQPSRLEKLERDYRTLFHRVEALEKKQGSSLPGLIAAVLLLLAVGVLVDYLGLLPRPVQRLPLHADSIETKSVTLTDADGTPRMRVEPGKDNLNVTRIGGAAEK